MKKIVIILIILVTVLFFWFVPVIQTTIFSGCTAEICLSPSHPYVSLKDFLLSKFVY